MVTGIEQEITPEVDPALEVTQTEIEEKLPDAAEEPVEAATEEGEKPLTRAEVEKLLSERESTIRTQAIEEARDLERRQRQSEEGRRAFEAQRQVKLRDAVSVSLTRKLGITEVDDDVADDIISRVQGVESEVIELGTAAAIDEAITAAAARAVGLNPGPVSPQAERYVAKFTGYMERLLSHQVVREFVSRDAKKAWEDSLPTVVEAEISKRNAKDREKTPELKRPEGSPSTLDNSDTERAKRLAFGGQNGIPLPTESDREWQRTKYPG